MQTEAGRKQLREEIVFVGSNPTVCKLVYRLRPVGKGGYNQERACIEMVEITLSLSTMISVLAALAVWEVIKNAVYAAAGRKRKAPDDPHEEDKRRAQERMLEGFDNLMSYDVDAARSAARGDMQ